MGCGGSSCFLKGQRPGRRAATVSLANHEAVVSHPADTIAVGLPTPRPPGESAQCCRLRHCHGYQVIFAHDITGSAYLGTVGLDTDSGESPSGQIAVVGRAGAANGVFVQTFDAAGNPADRGFHLAVLS